MPRKRNFERLRRTQGCLTDCVAYFLNKHPEHVPYFVYPRNGWNERLKDYLKRNGYRAHWNKIEFAPLKERGLQIVCGDSLKYKTYSHAVVYRGTRLVYDPLYPSKWKNHRITHRLVMTKIKSITTQ